MSFLNRALEPPAYGFTRNGKLYIPSRAEILREFRSRLNPLATRKNWLPVFFWSTNFLLLIPLFFFLKDYFSFSLLIVGVVYSLVGLACHGTLWLHRYCTHRSFVFRNSIWRFFVRNLVIKIIPEETYVISHHVHHKMVEEPGDPYNVYGGFLYCFLADVNHQLIARDLSEKDYAQLQNLLRHTGVRMNSYKEYLKWGSLCSPFYTVTHYVLNWTFWFSAFYFLGGPALALSLFGCSALWAFGVRTFNFDGHGGGKDKRVVGVDFNWNDLSVNQRWPGYVAGEWHNNHHLFPNSANNWFLPYQLDLPFLFIQFLHAIGGVVSFRDNKEQFMKNYYRPYLASLHTVAPPDLPPVPVASKPAVDSITTLLLAAIVICGTTLSHAGEFKLSSSMIKPNSQIADAQVFDGFGCTGKNISPALKWENPPKDTQAFALTMYDPDAPTGSGWWHWVVFNIPANVDHLAVGAGKAGSSALPKGAVQSRTDFDQMGYGGPCPPPGAPHRYIFRLYALKAPLDLNADTSAAKVGFFLNQTKLGMAEFTGIFGRAK